MESKLNLLVNLLTTAPETIYWTGNNVANVAKLAGYI